MFTASKVIVEMTGEEKRKHIITLLRTRTIFPVSCSYMCFTYVIKFSEISQRKANV